MEWLTQQAQSAGPFVAVFCLLALSVVVRELVKKDRTILSLTQSYGSAMQSVSVAMEKGAAATQALVTETRDTRNDINDLRVLLGGRKKTR